MRAPAHCGMPSGHGGVRESIYIPMTCRHREKTTSIHTESARHKCQDYVHHLTPAQKPPYTTVRAAMIRAAKSCKSQYVKMPWKSSTGRFCGPIRVFLSYTCVQRQDVRTARSRTTFASMMSEHASFARKTHDPAQLPYAPRELR